LANLIVSNHLSTAGEKIKALQAEIEELNAENAVLELEIAKESSVSGVVQKAKKLGFISSPQVFYLKGEIPMAMR